MLARKIAPLEDVGLLLLRLITGVTLVVHGFPKLFGGPEKQPPKVLVRAFGQNYPQAYEHGSPSGFAEALRQMNVPMPRVSAYLSGMAELFGGLALILGLMTRFFAPMAAFNMAVAARVAHWQTGFYGPGGYEFPVLLGSAAGTLFFTGPGALSLDAAIDAASNRKERKRGRSFWDRRARRVLRARR
ncbi:MAG TPA: DoxX family protein [Dehalococcoidia bacterium]|nr:DoxX family protein [Dehalococcoidia bacterium]